MGILDDLKALDAAAGNEFSRRQAAAQAEIDKPRGLLNPNPQGSTTDQMLGAITPQALGGDPPPAPGAQAPVALEDMPTVPGSNESGMDDTSGINAQDLGTRIGMPMVPTPMGGGPVAAIMPEGANMHPYGGQDTWNDTFVTKPQQMETAVMAGAQAEEDAGKAKAEMYRKLQADQEQQQAVIKQRQIENQQTFLAKQQQIDQASQRFTDDLADRGKFWRNPGNIIAAFGAALMTLGSDDHMIGIKIINNAIESDYKKRKELADMSMGELRSNLAAYRQIAGDREQGDKMALAESYRIGMMELDRIAGQFQGPIAKAKAAAIMKDMAIQRQNIMMQMYKAGVYNAPQIVNPAIANAYAAGGKNDPSGWHSFSGDGPKLVGKNGQVVGQQTATGPAAGAGVQAYFKSVDKQAQAGGFMTPEQEKTLNDRYPGAADQIKTERASVIRSIAARIGADPTRLDPRMTDAQLGQALAAQNPAFPKAFNKEMEGYQRFLAEDNKEIAQRVGPIAERMSNYRRLGQTMNLIEMTASKLGVSPDELIATRYHQVFGGSVKKLQEFMDASEPGTKHERQAREVADFISHFRQDAASAINTYMKATFGGTVTEGEQTRADQYIKSDHRWSSLRHFQKGVSADARAGAATALAGSKSALTSTAWNLRLGQDNPQLGYNGIQGSEPAPTGKPEPTHVQRAIQNLKGAR